MLRAESARLRALLLLVLALTAHPTLTVLCPESSAELAQATRHHDAGTIQANDDRDPSDDDDFETCACFDSVLAQPVAIALVPAVPVHHFSAPDPGLDTIPGVDTDVDHPPRLG